MDRGGHGLSPLAATCAKLCGKADGAGGCRSSVDLRHCIADLLNLRPCRGRSQTPCCSRSQRHACHSEGVTERNANRAFGFPEGVRDLRAGDTVVADTGLPGFAGGLCTAIAFETGSCSSIAEIAGTAFGVSFAELAFVINTELAVAILFVLALSSDAATRSFGQTDPSSATLSVVGAGAAIEIETNLTIGALSVGCTIAFDTNTEDTKVAAATIAVFLADRALSSTTGEASDTIGVFDAAFALVIGRITLLTTTTVRVLATTGHTLAGFADATVSTIGVGGTGDTFVFDTGFAAGAVVLIQAIHAGQSRCKTALSIGAMSVGATAGFALAVVADLTGGFAITVLTTAGFAALG